MKRVIKLEQRWDGGYGIKDERTMVCGTGLRRFFTVPKGTEKIWLTISDEPLEESYKVTIGWLRTCAHSIYLTRVEGGIIYRENTILELDKYILKRFGKVQELYVTVDYETWV